mmetsp:Transcript_28717/g.42578  ORF Transcript_28717/g.42578 Transcript_28717/m.42578 type:complete len:210 (+) Transcript_28717:76-705(+)
MHTCMVLIKICNAMHLQYSSSINLLSPLGPIITLNHIILLDILPILILPSLTLNTKLIHLTRIDRTILLPPWKTNNPHTQKIQIPNPILKLTQIRLHGNSSNEFKFDRFGSWQYRFNHCKLSRIRGEIGVICEYGFTREGIDYKTVDADFFKWFGGSFEYVSDDGYAESFHSLHCFFTWDGSVRGTDFCRVGFYLEFKFDGSNGVSGLG